MNRRIFVPPVSRRQQQFVLDDLSSDSDDEYFDVVQLPGLRPPQLPSPQSPPTSPFPEQQQQQHNVKKPIPGKEVPERLRSPPTHSRSMPAVNKGLASAEVGNEQTQPQSSTADPNTPVNITSITQKSPAETANIANAINTLAPSSKSKAEYSQKGESRFGAQTSQKTESAQRSGFKTTNNERVTNVQNSSRFGNPSRPMSPRHEEGYYKSPNTSNREYTPRSGFNRTKDSAADTKNTPNANKTESFKTDYEQQSQNSESKVNRPQSLKIPSKSSEDTSSEVAKGKSIDVKTNQQSQNGVKVENTDETESKKAPKAVENLKSEELSKDIDNLKAKQTPKAADNLTSESTPKTAHQISKEELKSTDSSKTKAEEATKTADLESKESPKVSDSLKVEESQKATDLKLKETLETTDNKAKVRPKAIDIVNTEESLKSTDIKSKDTHKTPDLKVATESKTADLKSKEQPLKGGSNNTREPIHKPADSLKTNEIIKASDKLRTQETASVIDIKSKELPKAPDNLEVKEPNKAEDLKSNLALKAADNLKGEEVPKSDLKSKEVPKSDLKSKEEPKSDLKSKEEPKSDLKSKEEPKSDLKSKAEPKSDLKSKAEPKSDLKSKEEPKSDLKSKEEPKSDLKAKEEPKSDLKSKTEPKSDLKSKTEPKSDLKSKEEPKSDPKSKEEPKSDLKSKVENKVDNSYSKEVSKAAGYLKSKELVNKSKNLESKEVPGAEIKLKSKESIKDTQKSKESSTVEKESISKEGPKAKSSISPTTVADKKENIESKEVSKAVDLELKEATKVEDSLQSKEQPKSDIKSEDIATGRVPNLDNVESKEVSKTKNSKEKEEAPKIESIEKSKGAENKEGASKSKELPKVADDSKLKEMEKSEKANSSALSNPPESSVQSNDKKPSKTELDKMTKYKDDASNIAGTTYTKMDVEAGGTSDVTANNLSNKDSKKDFSPKIIVKQKESSSLPGDSLSPALENNESSSKNTSDEEKASSNLLNKKAVGNGDTSNDTSTNKITTDTAAPATISAKTNQKPTIEQTTDKALQSPPINRKMRAGSPVPNTMGAKGIKTPVVTGKLQITPSSGPGPPVSNKDVSDVNKESGASQEVANAANVSTSNATGVTNSSEKTSCIVEQAKKNDDKDTTMNLSKEVLNPKIANGLQSNSVFDKAPKNKLQSSLSNLTVSQMQKYSEQRKLENGTTNGNENGDSDDDFSEMDSFVDRSRCSSVASDADISIRTGIKRPKSEKLSAIVNIWENDDVSQVSERSKVKPPPNKPKVGKISGLKNMFESGNTVDKKDLTKNPNLTKLRSQSSAAIVDPKAVALKETIPSGSGLAQMNAARFGGTKQFRKPSECSPSDGDKILKRERSTLSNKDGKANNKDKKIDEIKNSENDKGSENVTETKAEIENKIEGVKKDETETEIEGVKKDAKVDIKTSEKDEKMNHKTEVKKSIEIVKDTKKEDKETVKGSVDDSKNSSTKENKLNKDSEKKASDVIQNSGSKETKGIPKTETDKSVIVKDEKGKAENTEGKTREAAVTKENAEGKVQVTVTKENETDNEKLVNGTAHSMESSSQSAESAGKETKKKKKKKIKSDEAKSKVEDNVTDAKQIVEDQKDGKLDLENNASKEVKGKIPEVENKIPDESKDKEPSISVPDAGEPKPNDIADENFKTDDGKGKVGKSVPSDVITNNQDKTNETKTKSKKLGGIKSFIETVTKGGKKMEDKLTKTGIHVGKKSKGDNNQKESPKMDFKNKPTPTALATKQSPADISATTMVNPNAGPSSNEVIDITKLTTLENLNENKSDYKQTLANAIPALESEVEALIKEASVHLEPGKASRVPSTLPPKLTLPLRPKLSVASFPEPFPTNEFHVTSLPASPTKDKAFDFSDKHKVFSLPASPTKEVHFSFEETSEEEEVFVDAIDPAQLDTLMPLPDVTSERDIRSRSRTPMDFRERSITPSPVVAESEAILSETDRLLRRSRSNKSLRKSYSRSLSSAALNKLSEVSADLSEEHTTSHLAGERLEAEQAERMKLEKEVDRLQSDMKRMSSANGKLEMEKLALRSEVLSAVELNGDMDDDDAADASLYKRKYEWCLREIELLKKQSKQQQEDDMDQLMLLKKQLEKKVADAYEETDEQRQVVAQLKRKSQRLQAEMNDLKILLEEQTSRNNLLEKKQRKFDQEMMSAQEELRHERTNKDKIQRERDSILSEKYSFEQEVTTLKLELELKEEKVQALNRELDDLNSSGKVEEEVAHLKKTKHDLEMRIKDQEEELDDLAGQVQMLEGAKVRLEMSMEQMRKENRREISQREEELEEVRISAQKKVKSLEAQLENEHEERTLLVREKHELERRIGDLQDRTITHVDEDYVHKLKKELKKTKALLRDTQTMLEKAQSEGSHKLILRQLKTQLEDAEFAKTAALKARQCAESDLSDVSSQLDEALRSKKEAEDKGARINKERAELQTQLEESEEEVAEVMKKYKAVVSQLSVDQITLSEQSQQIAELEHTKQVLQERLLELTSKVEVLEGETANIHTQRRLEMKIKEIESKLELELTTRQRLESQIGRLKDQIERLSGECDTAKMKESQAQDQTKRLGRQLRDAKEDLSNVQQRQTEAVNKKSELEKQLELSEAEVLTLKSDLKLAFKRIEDLQQAIQGDLSDSDSDLSDSDSDSDGSLSSYLTASLKQQRSSSNSTLRTPPSEVQQLDRLDLPNSPCSEAMSAISEDLDDSSNKESFA